MSLDNSRKAWYAKGKAYYQREVNSYDPNARKARPAPFERLNQDEKDFYMARAQQFEQNYVAT